MIQSNDRRQEKSSQTLRNGRKMNMFLFRRRLRYGGGALVEFNEFDNMLEPIKPNNIGALGTSMFITNVIVTQSNLFSII